MDRRVVITGMGVLAPNGHGLPAYEKALREGISGVRFVPRMKELGFGCQVAGLIEGADELKARYFPPDLLHAMKARQIVYGAVASIDAWRDAGLEVPGDSDETVHWDTGAVLGIGSSPMEYTAETVVPQVSAGKIRRMGSTVPEQIMASGVGARVTGLLSLGGPVSTNSSACTTGTEAVVQAYLTILHGRAERMLAGGVEEGGVFTYGGFDSMRVLATGFNETPEKASRPMSASASGFVPGSGAGVLVLESLERARARGARIYAEVLGGSVVCGGHRGGGSMTAPNPEGVRRCLRAAIAEAGIRSDEIDTINGHLTATMADPLEIANWRDALEVPPGKFPLINSTKSLIGHALGAAGGLECVASVLQLHKGFVHGSLNCEDPHPRIEPYAARIPHVTVEADVRVLAKASFGFGDVNGCVILKRWDGDGR